MGYVHDFWVFLGFLDLDVDLEGDRGVLGVKMIRWGGWVRKKGVVFFSFFALLSGFWSKKMSFIGFFCDLVGRFCAGETERSENREGTEEGIFLTG